MKTRLHTSLLSRRRLITGLSGALIAGNLPAFAGVTPSMRIPASIAYGRFDANGQVDMTAMDRQTWEAMARRIGGGIARMEPFQSSNFLPMQAPDLDGGAAAALAARNMAGRSGYDYVLLYAVIWPETPTAVERDSPVPSEGVRAVRKRIGKKVRWVFSSVAKGPFANSTDEITQEPAGPVRGEAHLLDVAGGGAITSSWAEAPINKSWGIMRAKTDPETELLEALSQDMERRLQGLMRAPYDARRSIAR